MQVFATLLAVAAASPIDDTPEVKAAKEAFNAAFAAAEAGEHAALAPEQVATAYLADVPEVSDAKAAFMKTFDAYANGEIPAPVAPAAPVVPAPVVSVAAPYLYNNYYGYPAAHYGYYNNAAYGLNPYHYGGYAAYPYTYGLPVLAAAPAAKEE